MLTDSELGQPVSTDTDVDQLFDMYDAVLWKFADDLAPVHNIRRHRGRLAPWFDTECRSLRQECRRLERRYRRTYTAEHRRSWVDATRRRHQAYRSKREQYWLERVSWNIAQLFGRPTLKEILNASREFRGDLLNDSRV